MKPSLGLAVFISAAFVPSCLVYDAALLEQAVGGEEQGDGDGDDLSTGGGAVGVGGSVGDGDGGNGDGDGSGSGGGGPGSGGTSATGGNGSGGETQGGSGGNSSTGGSTGECDPNIEETGEFTGVASKSLLDDFEQAWNGFGNWETYTGRWFVVSSDPDNTTLSPFNDSWSYQHEVCSNTEALHITGTGFEGSWGASYDAQLLEPVADIDLSEFTGVAFWARSGSSNQMKVAISDSDETNGTGSIDFSNAFPLSNKWKQYLLPFPGSANLAKARIIHFVAAPDDAYDIWLDDVHFYVAE